MKGSIDNVGFHCPSDTFNIAIAPPVSPLSPLSPLSPCEMLAKVHAVQDIGAGLTSTILENSFTAWSGLCTVSVARLNDLELVVSTSRSTRPMGIGGTQATALASPRTGAALYAATDGNFFRAIVIFHRGASWSALSYDFQHSRCPSSTPAGTCCVTKGVLSSITSPVESSKRHVYTLL
ncbi:MAG TPA: hypothetical protein VIJ86_05255 [Acidimicrobiales bacterium]